MQPNQESATSETKRPWSKPAFEQQSLKDALGGGGGTGDAQGGGYS